MSVRRRRRRDPKTGAVREVWMVDVDYELATGKRERVRKVSPVQTRRGAEEFERQVRQSLLDGSHFRIGEEVKEKAVLPTFDEFKDRFMTYSRVNNKPSTLLAKQIMWRVHLAPFFGKKKLDAIGPVDVEDFKAQKLIEGQAKKSINNYLAALRKALNLAVEWEIILKAPKVKAFKQKIAYITREEFFDFDEVDRVVAAVAADWRAFTVIGLKTGLRSGELLGLQWQDIALVPGQLVVRRTAWRHEEGTPKGGCNRLVPLSDEAVATLKGIRHLKGPYVFCEPDGKRFTHNDVADVIPMACKKAGLAKRLTTHGLRHTFASHLVMRGVSLMAVKELLGHESIEMTLRYAHLSPDVKRDAVKLLDVAGRPANGTLTAPRAVSGVQKEETPGNSESYQGLDGAGKGI
jgi:integrase